MREEDTAELPPHERPLFAGRQEGLVAGAVWVGALLALVGLIDGVVMTLNKKVASCPDGKYFPDGTTDFTCYVHPQAGVGIAVAALSIVLGILVVLSGIVATATLRSRATADSAHSQLP